MSNDSINSYEPTMEEIVSLCKRRGFLFQSGEIYGGLQGIYDYGPLGVELKQHLKAAWWKAMVYDRDDIEGLDSAILSHRLALKYSGHEETFTDPMIDCKTCKHRMRADQMVRAGECDLCHSKDLTEKRHFNLMFKTQLGPVEEGASLAYLRPETAQGIFVNFKNVLDSTSRKLPFGIAQIGKAFRNEVTPRNFIFRVREFEQMELEFFVEPGTDETWHSFWVEERKKFWIAQGLSSTKLKLYAQPKEELAHYAKATTDILYEFPFGVQELEGVANRTDFDLSAHSKETHLAHSKNAMVNQDSVATLSYVDKVAHRECIPYVIEPSAGLDRAILALLVTAYTKETLADGQERIVLKLRPHLSPIKAAVIPLAKNNPEIVSQAKEIQKELQALRIGRIRYEDIGNVGKAYRRHDEVGTPLCITVDFETIENTIEPTVTIRYRDSMQQERIAIKTLPSFVANYCKEPKRLIGA